MSPRKVYWHAVRSLYRLAHHPGQYPYFWSLYSACPTTPRVGAKDGLHSQNSSQDWPPGVASPFYSAVRSAIGYEFVLVAMVAYGAACSQDAPRARAANCETCLKRRPSVQHVYIGGGSFTLAALACTDMLGAREVSCLPSRSVLGTFSYAPGASSHHGHMTKQDKARASHIWPVVL